MNYDIFITRSGNLWCGTRLFSPKLDHGPPSFCPESIHVIFGPASVFSVRISADRDGDWYSRQNTLNTCHGFAKHAERTCKNSNSQLINQKKQIVPLCIRLGIHVFSGLDVGKKLVTISLIYCKTANKCDDVLNDNKCKRNRDTYLRCSLGHTAHQSGPQ